MVASLRAAAASAAASARLACAAAFARRAFFKAAPYGERGKRDDRDEDNDGRGVHFAASFRAGRNIAHRQNASTAIASAVQIPKPPPAMSTPMR